MPRTVAFPIVIDGVATTAMVTPEMNDHLTALENLLLATALIAQNNGSAGRVATETAWIASQKTGA